MSQKLFDKMQWSTIIDMDNKLIIHVAHLVKDYKIDTTKCDPDGVPLVFIAHERVTRVRKMTEKEFEEAVKEFGYNYEINMVYAPIGSKTGRVSKEEKDDNNKKGTRHST
jgi:hypothetical protein